MKYSLQTDTGKPCSNPFICYTLGNGNGSQVDDSNKKYRVYTDTDSDGKTEIITDINCKFKGKLFAMEVKVDPGSETNCIPLSHFRCLFCQLCHTLPKRNILSVQQVTITISKFISGPIHPPKVKYSPKHQNVCTTSHRKTRKLSPSMLRATSRATKTPRLYKPLHLRTPALRRFKALPR